MLTPIQEVRVSVGDLDVSFPILDDNTYQYFLDKNSSSVRRASLDAARTILFYLSTRGEETVDIFSIKGAKASSEYRLALQLYLTNPNLNPVYSLAGGYAGGISKSDMISNITTSDNNAVITPGMRVDYIPKNPSDPFSI